MASDSQRPSAFPNNGSKIGLPKLDALKKDPKIGALIDKLVSQGNTPNGSTPFTNRGVDLPNDSLLRKVADITATNVNDAASMFQLLPDTELAAQILISSILSPEDMMETNLIYKSNMDVKDGELSAALLDVIKTYFDQVYKIRPLLTKWLKDALFLIGCYPMVILPENVLDAAINSSENVSMEAFKLAFSDGGRLPNVGVLGNGTAPRDEAGPMPGITLESLREIANPLKYDPQVNVSLEEFNKLFDHTDIAAAAPAALSERAKKFKETMTIESVNLSVTDNINVLKIPLIQETLRAERIQKAFSKARVSMEDRVQGEHEAISINQMERALYKHRRYKNVPVLPLMPIVDPKRPTLGHPLAMKIPSEALIPVHVPGNPQQHLGYFGMMDINGNFLTRASQTDYYTDLTTNLNANQEMVSQLLATTKRAEYGRETNREIDQEEIARVYAELVEKDLLNRLRNGIYGHAVEIARPTEIYQVMLSRALAKMHTQLVYIPAEFVVYIAFDYNKYGVGMSLLQKNKIVGGMRSMIMFANTMGAIKNSIQRVVLNITLDPDDPNPANTVEFMLHEYAKTRQASYPLGASNPLDIISFLQNAGVEVAVSGNTRYPETKLSIEDKSSQHAKPDTELEDTLRKRYLQGIGVTPEMVDAASGAEFATTVVRNNLIMAKRVKDLQGVLMHFTVEFIQKYTVNSSILLEQLIDVINTNKHKIPEEYHHEEKDEDGNTVHDDASPAQRYLTMFLKSLETSLPEPDVAEQKTQFEAFQQYDQFIDLAIKAYIDEEAMEQTFFGEYAQAIPVVKKLLANHYKRQWLREQGILKELDDLVLMDDEEAPRLKLEDTEINHAEGLMKSIGDMLKKVLKWQKSHPMPTATDGQIPSGDQNGSGAVDEFGNPIDNGGTDDFGNPTGSQDNTGELDENGNPINPEGNAGAPTESSEPPQFDDEGNYIGERSSSPEGSGAAPGEEEAPASETEPASGEEGKEAVAPEEGSGKSEPASGAPEEGAEEEEEESSTETPPASGEPASGAEEKETKEEKPKEGEESSESKPASGTEETAKETPSSSEKSSGETEEEK
jgi:hypothetical protein